MNRRTFNQYVSESNFRELFISEMGWNNPQGQTLFDIIIDETPFEFQLIAERSGFQVLTCLVDAIPTSSLCKKLDTRLRRSANDYICIFIQKGTSHHLWAVPVKKVEKRDIVLVEYLNAEAAGFLFEKIEGLSFDLDERTTITDVVERVQAAFIVNSEKVTKDFYTGFKKEHTNFAKFISGIDDQIADKDNRNKQWYTSVMLNRLMFCYFIQKKGFLDGDVDYLRHKLEWTQQERGENRFFSSFYKGFLTTLFHGGLNTPKHDRDFENVYGRIPYLNGGMFDVHQIEQDYAELDIADDAFISLFNFFDKWHWHLDDRLTATGKDINPDVLGYIFEQYINDRAQMGAYYTKEDITEYIGRNTIVPYLMEATLGSRTSRPQTEKKIWQFLQQNGDRYIFDAVKKGQGLEIPEEVAIGLDTQQPNLLERRKHWNDRTPEAFALPTEIWRETIERLQRYNNIKAKIANGEITSINDFITYNLDIRQFVYDLLNHTDDHLLVKHFYAELQKVTILDPTCGSGAFLFAALNILEPLYEVCISRMQEFREQNPNLFKDELQEIEHKYRSNIQYFIYKSIILRNLYGVDIMVEAAEIAKLRLFLKMVAVVEVNKREANLGLDPLPDIDFNIRCGNTLVGYATKAELDRDLSFAKDILEELANQELKQKLEDEMDKVAHTYDMFKHIQLTQGDDMATFKRAKADLKDRLKALNDLLNRRLFMASAGADYEAWLASHQPFHWLAEFYEIINGNGGFDVIIGNPPYVSMSEINYLKGDETYNCSDLYGFVIRRVTQILNPAGFHGFIVMHNLAFSRNFSHVRNLLLNKEGSQWYSFYSRIPDGLFSGDVRVRNCIYLLAPTGNGKFTSRLHRWFKEQREVLFSTSIEYNLFKFNSVIPMLNSEKIQMVYENTEGKHILSMLNPHGTKVFYKKVAYNFLSVSFVEPPAYNKDQHPVPQTKLGSFKIEEEYYPLVLLLLCGKFYISKWLTYGDDFDLTEKDLLSFAFPFDSISRDDIIKLKQLYKRLLDRMPNTVQFKLNAGINVGTFNTSALWNITDESDMIFYKYLSANPEEIRELVESHLAKCVISNKA